jgi:protein O-GlcNAc transferase
VNRLKSIANLDDISEAIVFHKKGMLSEAKQIYKQYIKLNPNNDHVLYLCGLAEYQEKNYLKAIEYFQRAIGLSPLSAEYFKDLGNCYKHLKKYDLAFIQYQKALHINSQFPEAHYDMGILHLIKNEWDLSIDCFEKAITLNQEFVNAYINLGIAHQKQRNFKETIIALSQAKKLRPNDELIYFSLGNAFFSLGEASQAQMAFKKAITLNPLSAETYCNLGMTYREMNSYPKAVDCFEKAIAINPDFEDPYLLLGNLYQLEGRYESAISWFEKSLKINPKNAFIHLGMGGAYFEIGEEKKSLDFFKKCVELDYDFAAGYSSLVKVMLKTCSWKNLKKYNQRLDRLTLEALDQDKKVFETPFLNLVRHQNPKINYRIASAHSRLITQKIKNTGIIFDFRQRKSLNKKIHIGYLSNNFRNHPTAILLQEIFGTHNRNNFKISCYSYGPDDDSEQRRHIKKTCDNFVDIDKLKDIEAAEKIYGDEVDILVDLVGYLKGHRIDISAFHPAPVQIRWLGMAGTTGSDFFEYLITDQVVTPINESNNYSERFIYFPKCYQVNSYESLELKRAKKEDWGLPSDHFIFCSFNASYKLDSNIYKCWLEILKEIPKSVLLLLIESELAKENLKKIAIENGVSSERIQYVKRLSITEHLRRLSCVDLALDTTSVNGAATTSDALWVDVPVLTIKGRHFASRMSASILEAIGLSELILDNLYDYKKKCIQLARNPTALDIIKKRMNDNKKHFQLFNTKNAVKTLEKTFKLVWNIYRKGGNPRLLSIN